MLTLAKGCASTMRAPSLMYHKKGHFALMTQEDLTGLRTLFEVCLAGEPLGLDLRVKIAINCCRAVAELHALDIIHGDLSCLNFMIADDQSAKLVGFDCAAKVGWKVRSACNFDFVPKQRRAYVISQKYVPATCSWDLYSLALCCFMLLGS